MVKIPRSNFKINMNPSFCWLATLAALCVASAGQLQAQDASKSQVQMQTTSSQQQRQQQTLGLQPQSLALVAAASKSYEACKVQSRIGQQFTNLSQIMFHPQEICSSWLKMMRAPISSSTQPVDDSTLGSYPWLAIEQLNLSQNNLTVLHDSSGMHALVNLIDLSITNNQLARCEESALAGLRSLQTLDLSHNRLVALPARFFQPVKSTIKKLNLSFNSIAVLVPTLFESLTNLEYLDLSHNGITSIWFNDILFQNLTHLHYLDLSFNRLSVFSSPMIFSSLQQLETLSLQGNELRQVPETIQHLHYLSSLDLSQNHIQNITNASYLSNCRSLFNLNLESNLIENITRDAFSDLPALKVLNLANNRIHHLDQQAFDYVSDLHALRLDSNRLTDFGHSFVNLRFLLMLNISSNRISSFDYARIPIGLQWLDMHSNRIERLDNYYYSQSAKLQYATGNNDINQHLGNSISHQWQSMLRLTTLDASFNLIRELDNTSLPDSLETAQLNNNQIRNIASHTFTTKSNLTRINLSYNQLSTLHVDALRLQGNRDINSVSNTLQQPTVLSSSGSSQQKFVDVYLANNPFICNCDMGWLSQLLLASSSYLQSGFGGNYASTTNNQPSHNHLLREHQLIMSRQLPRIADAHLTTCHLPFARQASSSPDHTLWSPVSAANQLAMHHSSSFGHHPSSQYHQSHNQVRGEKALILEQSELLASVHLCTYKSHCFALCTCCDFDACDCEMICPDNCSCYYDATWSSNIVDCSANNQIMASPQSQRVQISQSYGHQYTQQRIPARQVRFSDIPEKIPMDVTELYLDGLELYHLRGNALIGRKNLKSLYLNNSQVRTIEPRAFATQKALRILQLNQNYLVELHGHEFEQQTELQELYLANNQLSSIANNTFSSLRSLRILHLQGNQLYHMDFWSNFPSGHKINSLSLGSNPWSCQCHQVEVMLEWLQLNLKNLADRKSINCQYNRTSFLHLLPFQGPMQISGLNDNDDSPAMFIGSSSSDNYPMFNMQKCLNHTVYPIIQLSTSPPSNLPFSSSYESSQRRDSAIVRENSPFGPMSPHLSQIPGYPNDELSGSSSSIPFENTNNSNSNMFIPGIPMPLPNDEPSIARPFDMGQHQRDMNAGTAPAAGYANGSSQIDIHRATEHISAAGYLFPPAGKSTFLSSSLFLGFTSMVLMIVILVLSLVHYRRPMRNWFHTHYGIGAFSAAEKSQNHHHHAIGSLGKHSHLNQAHLSHPYGPSSAASTSSSSAASSANLSHHHQTLGQHHYLQHQQTCAAPASGLVTTPLIVTNNNNQLLSHQTANNSTATTATTSAASPYAEDQKLFDAYLSYSKFDEQFVNDFIAPELEYGQPSYRVALHYRDVPASVTNLLPDCIVETANASRRIIMLLSEQLLRCEWAQFEFRTAHMEALRSCRRDRLIVILLGQPPVGELAPELLAFIKAGAHCIQWGEKLFWQRLRLALPELPFARNQAQYLRYQTLAPHQQQANAGQQAKQPKQTLGAQLLKSTGLFGGSSSSQQQQQQAYKMATSSSVLANLTGPATRPLPQPATMSLVRSMDEHHYAHLTPSTMIQQQQQQQHTYHQPIYGATGDLGHQLNGQPPSQQQPARGDNSAHPVHI